MSKKVKSLIEKELAARFKDVDGVAVLNPRGINAIKNNNLRRKLHEKGARMTVVKNTLARRATAGSKIKGFESLLDGPSAVIYGSSISQIARLLLDEKKIDDTLELRGMFFDGEVYIGAKGVEQVSKMPTREEAIGTVVALILSPARNLASAIKAPGGKLASIFKTIEENAKKREAAVPPKPEAAAPAPEAATTTAATDAPASA